MLLAGSILLVFIGFVHSYLGEKYILIRLFRRENLPQLMGSDWFTKRVLRFAWHLTTITWWGFAAILTILSKHDVNYYQDILLITSMVFGLSGVVSLIFSHGKHLSWLFFFAITFICFYSANYH